MPWYAKLLLKLGQSKIVAAVKAFFTAKPGLLRTVVVLYVVAVPALAFFHLGDPARIVTEVFTWLGLAAQTAGLPVDPAALGAAVTTWLKATVALLALARPVVRWIAAGFKAAVPAQALGK